MIADHPSICAVSSDAASSPNARRDNDFHPYGAVTLVTLSGVTDAATMRKISFWRYFAVKRKTIFTAFACALLVFSMLGCGTNNKLQSIQLNASLINGVAPSSQAGFFTLEGNGGTIQLQAIATYTNTKTKDLSNAVTYTMIVDPVNGVDAFGNPLPAPPETAQISITGLVTAVEPATCTWVDVSSTPTTPSWFYSGDYVVTATYQGVTSQPVYIPVASSAGSPVYPYPNGVANNPTQQCGPTS